MRLRAAVLATLGAMAVSASAQVPALEYKRVDLTVAQVTTLNTSPVPILPAVDGYVYALEWAECLHTGRYATAPGGLFLRATGTNIHYGAFSAAACLLNAPTNGFSGAFTTLYGQGGLSDSGTQYGSKAMEAWNACQNSGTFNCATAPSSSPTVDGTFPGSDVSIIVFYRLLPSYQTNAPPVN